MDKKINTCIILVCAAVLQSETGSEGLPVFQDTLCVRSWALCTAVWVLANSPLGNGGTGYTDRNPL